MTDQEFQAAQAAIADADTEIGALDQQIRECIEQSRQFNDARRLAETKRRLRIAAIEPTRQVVAAHVAEVKRQQAARAKAEAEAKAAQEAAARKAAEVSEVARLTAEVERLKAEAAAKG